VVDERHAGGPPFEEIGRHRVVPALELSRELDPERDVDAVHVEPGDRRELELGLVDPEQVVVERRAALDEDGVPSERAEHPPDLRVIFPVATVLSERSFQLSHHGRVPSEAAVGPKWKRSDGMSQNPGA
jgi:hypothetical protein